MEDNSSPAKNEADSLRGPARVPAIRANPHAQVTWIVASIIAEIWGHKR